eukprot:PhF_6_TR9694/c0_g1_i1/m.14918
MQDDTTTEIFAITGRIQAQFSSIVDLGETVPKEQRATSLHELRREIDSLRRRCQHGYDVPLLPPILRRKMDLLSLQIHSALEELQSDHGTVLASQRRAYDKLEEEFLSVVCGTNPDIANDTDGHLTFQRLLELRQKRTDLFLQIVTEQKKSERIIQQHNALRDSLSSGNSGKSNPGGWVQSILNWGGCRPEITHEDLECNADVATNAMREDLIGLLNELEGNIVDAIRQVQRVYALPGSDLAIPPEPMTTSTSTTTTMVVPTKEGVMVDMAHRAIVTKAQEIHRAIEDDESKLRNGEIYVCFGILVLLL